MRKPELVRWREDVLAAGERWCRAMDAGPGHDGDVGRARDAMRHALGFPPECFSTFLPPVPVDDEAPGDLPVEKLEVLGYEVPTLNRVKHLHWSRRKRDRDMLKMQIVQQLRQPDGPANGGGAHRGRHGRRMPKPVPRRCHLTIYRRRVRGVDEDNIIGGCKDLHDCIEAVGLIWEDSPLWYRPSYELRKCDNRNGPGVELELWDVPQTTWTDAQRRVVERAKLQELQPAWVRKDRARAKARVTELFKGR